MPEPVEELPKVTFLPLGVAGGEEGRGGGEEEERTRRLLLLRGVPAVASAAPLHCDDSVGIGVD